jgi:hypothetical protein
MNQNTNNLTALFKENISEFCSLQGALYYILLGIVPCGDSKIFQQNVNNALILKHNFSNNPYLQDSNLNTNSGTIKSDISDSIITEYDKYCIELEKLCQNASNDLRELLFNGTIKTCHAESKNLIPKGKLQDLTINFKYWESDENIVINFKDLLKIFPIEQIHKPKHYKIITNGVQLIILDDITSKRSEAKIKKNKEKISTIAKNDVIIPMYIKLSEENKKLTEKEKTKKIHKDLSDLAVALFHINPIYSNPLNDIRQPTEFIPSSKEKDSLIQNFADRYKINALHLESIMREYYHFEGSTRYDTLCRWCRKFENQQK